MGGNIIGARGLILPENRNAEGFAQGVAIRNAMIQREADQLKLDEERKAVARQNRDRDAFKRALEESFYSQPKPAQPKTATTVYGNVPSELPGGSTADITVEQPLPAQAAPAQSPADKWMEIGRTAFRYGASPESVLAFQKQGIDQAKNLAALDKDTFELKQRVLDQQAQALQAVKEAYQADVENLKRDPNYIPTSPTVYAHAVYALGDAGQGIPPQLSFEDIGKQLPAFNAHIGLSKVVMDQVALNRLREAQAYDTPDIKEYNFARSQGYNKSFPEWQEEQANLKQQATGGSEFERAYMRQYGRSPSVEELKAFRQSTRQEPGSFVILTDDRGRVTGAWNPKSGRVEEAPPEFPGARKSGVPAAMLEAEAGFGTLINQFDTLRTLVKSRPDAIGFFAGRIGKARAATLGDDPEAASIYQTAQDISNQLVYLLSGKQINEQEYNRLRAALPTAELPLKTFMVRLDNFERRLKDVYLRRFNKELRGTEDVEAPSASGEQPSAPAPTGKVKSAEDLKRKYGLK